MDRQIVYPGAIPLETDVLNTNKYAMLGLAKLASSLLGANTYVHGLACTPSSPASMVINVAAGQIYSLQNVDGTAYSSLAADTTHSILKQGIVMDATAFTLTAPSTSGYSINYLVQVTYTDTDSGATVLPYYNASNPSVAYSGPNNSGTAQNTVRSGVCTVALKAGVAATTGAQATPSPDTGYTGLWVITVAQGATTVTAANIAVYANAPFLNQAGIYDSFQRNSAIYGTDTGVANAYVVNVNPGMLSLTAGAEVIFKATNANTSSSTLNVSALGAYPIISKAGATLIASEIVANSLVKVRWSAVASSWVLIDATGTFSTGPTASPGNNTTQVATTAFVTAAILAASGKLTGRQVITSSGTYTPTTGTKRIKVFVTGAGGGGGGSAATDSTTRSCGGGGGGGSTVVAIYDIASITTPVSITIGTGGTAGAAGGSTGGNGGAGGSTLFGSIITAAGGFGGGGGGQATTSSSIVNANGGANTASSGGDYIIRGLAGLPGITASSGNVSGAGGASFFSGGGNPVSSGTSTVGDNGVNGSGGSGGLSIASSATGRAGGVGGAGFVVVEEYA